MSNMVGNPDHMFSYDAAHIISAIINEQDKYFNDSSLNMDMHCVFHKLEVDLKHLEILKNLYGNICH